MSDQQRTDSLACYGNVFVHSPNIDRLASEGVRFLDGFSPYPLCTPARAALWTGTYPHLHGIMDCVYGIADAFESSPVPTTVFDRLSKAGYLVGYFGKWHLGERRPASMDHWDATDSAEGHWVTGRDYIPEAQTRRMNEFLQRLRGEKRPFFLVQSYRPPHEPYTAPERDMCLYRGKGIFRPGYYASVTALDRCVGDILKTLEQIGARGNTLVIYTSDHGESMGRRGLWGKFTLYEESAAVPLILAGPDVPVGQSTSDPVTLVDCHPTILEAVGVEAESGDADLPGRSLWSIAGGEPLGRAAFSEYHAVGTTCGSFMIRHGSHKYIHYVGEEPQLFDLAADPFETIDLAHDPNSVGIRERMEALLAEILDPDEVDARAKADQAALVSSHGGREAVLARGTFVNSPVPGEEPRFESGDGHQ